MSNGQKISQFTGVTTLNDSDLVTVVSQGQNFNITYGDLKTSLGVSGSLESIGDVLATPILNNPSGNEYQIRRIANGPGISFSVDANNGITGKWNVTQDSTGFPVVNNLGADQPSFNSLVAGTGMVLAQDGEVITITATGEANPVGTIIINSMDDFTVQDDVSFTLEAGRIYQFASNISTDKYCIVGDGAKFTANNFFSPTFTYTGTGAMFRGTDASFRLTECRIDCPNGTFFDFVDTVGNTKLFLMDTVRLVSGQAFGTFNNLQTVQLNNSSSLSMTQGAVITGVNMSVLTISKLFLASTSGSFVALDITGSLSLTTEIDDLIAVGPAGSIGIKGDANSANVQAGALATVSGCNLAGVASPLSGITNKDIRWQFVQNSGVPDTITDALVHTSSNALETTITAANTAVKLNAVFITDALSRFTHDGTGRVVFTGERDQRIPIDVTTTILTATGGSKQVSVYVAVNGSVVAATGKQGTASSSAAASITTFWQHTFQTGDYVEIWVENNDDAVNIIGQQALLRIN